MIDNQDSDGTRVRVVFPEPDPSIAVYANHLVVYHTDDEFVCVFYRFLPPQLWGRDTEELGEVISVEAEPMAKIIIPVSKMEDFAKAMQTNFERFQVKQTSDTEEEQNGS